MLIETGRLSLRVLELRDRDFILELVSGADWIQNIGDRGVRTPDDAETYIAKIRASQTQHGFSFYGVFLKETETGIGICGLTKREELPLPDVGFAFIPKYYRQGYATEAGLAVLKYAKESLGFTEVAGIVVPENVGSIRTLEKLGLQFEREYVREFDLQAKPGLYYSRKL